MTNYAKQSQFKNRSQKTEDRRRRTEVRAASVSKRVLIRLSDHQRIGVQDISRPGNQDPAQVVRQLSRILYKSALFLQSKANFGETETNVSFFATKDYEKIAACEAQKAKPTKPNFKGKKCCCILCDLCSYFVLCSRFGFSLCSHSGSCSRETSFHKPLFRLRALACSCWYLL